MQTNIEDIETVDLADALQQATEQKIFIPVSDNIETSTETVVNDNKDDFDTDILNEPDNTTDNANGALYDSSKLAPAIVDGGDMLIQQMFPILYEKSAFTKDEIIGMKAFAYRQKIQAKQRETTITEDEQKYAALLIEYDEYVESLPLTVKEKQSIIEPLKTLLKDVNYQTSPGNALIIAVGMVMLPRLLPVASKKFFTDKK